MNILHTTKLYAELKKMIEIVNFILVSVFYHNFFFSNGKLKVKPFTLSTTH